MISSVTLRSLYALVSHLCLTGLPEQCHIRTCGKIARNIPAHKSSYRSVDPIPPTWKRPPGRPRTKWTDQLRRDNNNVPTATLWRQAIGRGHSRATLRSEPTIRVNDDDDDHPHDPSVQMRPIATDAGPYSYVEARGGNCFLIV